MKKIAYIIPGYEESRTSRKAYDIIASYFKDAGMKPVHVPIKWKMKKPIDFEVYSEQFLKKYKKGKGDETYILGFSFGAVIAFLTEQKTKPDAIILCSLSPYFKEDYKNLKSRGLKWWETNFINEFEFNDLVKKYHTRSFLLAGDRESHAVQHRVKEAKKKMKSGSLFVVNGAAHNINNRSYLRAIQDVVSKL